MKGWEVLFVAYGAMLVALIVTWITLELDLRRHKKRMEEDDHADD